MVWRLNDLYWMANVRHRKVIYIFVDGVHFNSGLGFDGNFSILI